MKLGELMQQYRAEHCLSQRKFAEISGLSSGYIAMLEKGRQSTTGKPIVPTMDTMFQLAKAMGMTVDELCRAVDGDTVVKVRGGEQPLSDNDERLLALFRLLPEDQKQRILDSIEFSLRSQGLLK